jgi:hypothetical protein
MNDTVLAHNAVSTQRRRIRTAAASVVWVAMTGWIMAQSNALRIVVLEGEDAVNIISQKTAVKPTVEVRDRNDLPAAGAAVVFVVRGRGATFANGARQLSVTTDSLGRATVSELTPIGKGTVEIQVSANYQGQAATATIHQTNFATAAEAAKAGRMPAQSGQSATSGSTGTTTATTTAGAAGGAGGGLSGLAIAGIIGGAAAGTAVGVAAVRNKNGAPSVSGVAANPPVGLQNSTTIAFTSSASDPDGDPVTYSWNFGDGATSTDAAPTHLYAASGAFAAHVTVSDGKTNTDVQAPVTIKNMTGTWLGTVTSSVFGQVTIAYTLTQSGGAVAGTATPATGPGGTVTGGAVAATTPRVTFVVTITGFSPFTFTGDPTADINTVNGVYNGSGFQNQTVTLTRQ